MFSSPAVIEAGQLVYVLVDPDAAIQKLQPFCTNVVGRAEIVCADQGPSKATLLKLIGNTVVGSFMATPAEGHMVAVMSRLGAQLLHRFAELMVSGVCAACSNRMLTSD